MGRLPPLDREALNERQREVYDAIASGPRGGVRGPLAVWLRRPDLADKAQALGRYCRFDSSLTPALSELAILVTARVWNSEFEWQAHKKIAIDAGISPAIADAIRRRERPEFDDEIQAVVHDFALAVHADRRVSQELFDRATAALGTDGVIDLTGVLGYYGLISMTINVFEIDPPNPDAIEMD